MHVYTLIKVALDDYSRGKRNAKMERLEAKLENMEIDFSEIEKYGKSTNVEKGKNVPERAEYTREDRLKEEKMEW